MADADIVTPSLTMDTHNATTPTRSREIIFLGERVTQKNGGGSRV